MIGRVVVLVAHTWPELQPGRRVEVGRIISARKATAHERRAYPKAGRERVLAMRWKSVVAVLVLSVVSVAAGGAEETWRGLVVAPEHRCSPYDKRDYPYSQALEREIVQQLGAVYEPYTGACFRSRHEVDIEHIVATSEAHDSGLCDRDGVTRERFASDLRNLALASPDVGRHQKRDKDAAEWLPDRNRCWFAARVVEVRRAYDLTIDWLEAAALELILRECKNTEMELMACNAPSEPNPRDNILERYDDNGNGRITCKEARRHGIAPVARSHPAYPYMRDGDGDGMVCE